MFDENGINLARHVCLLGLAVTCAYTDLARGKLYNLVTLGGLVIGLVLAYFLDAAHHSSFHFPLTTFVVRSALAAALGGGVLFLVYLVGGFDAGDVKMMAAVGALGPQMVARNAPPGATIGTFDFILWALTCTALVGAVIAIGILIWQGKLWSGLKDSARAMVSLRRAPRDAAARSVTMPYGLAIGIGTLWAWMELML